MKNLNINITSPVDLNPGLYVKIEFPHRPAWMYIVEIWSDKFKEKPLATGAGIQPENAYRDALTNLKELTRAE